MRLTRSLALWLAGTTGVVLSSYAWTQLRQEREDLSTTARREMVLLTTAIRSGVENAMRDEQQLDITSLLERLQLEDSTVDIFVFDDPGGSLLASSWGSGAQLAAARAFLRAASASDTLFIEEEASGLLAATPLRIRGSSVGRLVVIRPTDALKADLDAELEAAVLSTLILIATLSLVIWLVIRQRVHLPMTRIVTGIRRMSGGDLSIRLQLTGGDEIGEIAREFDAMAAHLEEARTRLVLEAERRDQLELDMQRANKLTVVGELAATLAHEIGSPLQVLNGRARALAARSDLPEDARRGAEILVEQTDRVDRIVQRVLGIARRKASLLTEIDLREPVQLVADLMAVEARRRRVRIELDLQEVAAIRADADQLQQVMLNLLQNALRACSAGGTVRIAIAASWFTPPSSSTGRPSVAVSVEDTGTGISESVRAHIFEPFFTAWSRQNGPDASAPGGTGLGLSVVKSIVTEHGGTVTVGPHPDGNGTRFTVHFPLPEATHSPPSETR
jgi:signal transduction histidine kinase